MYVYEARNNDFVVGIVYVNSKAWPSYVQHLKRLLQERTDETQYYATNKDTQVVLPTGIGKKPKDVLPLINSGPFDV